MSSSVGRDAKMSFQRNKDSEIRMGQSIDLKLMLENVQCEAKNLKLLLNLKDEQIQMY
jgi:hypothetical protein